MNFTPQQMINILEIRHDIGLNLHIHKRKKLPHLKEFRHIDSTKWKEFVDKIETDYDWDPSCKIIWDQYSLSDEQVKIYCVHLNAGITIFKDDNHDKVQLAYDYQSDTQILEKLEKNITDLQNQRLPNSIGLLQINRGNLYVRFCEFKPYDVDLIKYLSKGIRDFRKELEANLKASKNNGLYLIHGDPGTGKTSFIKSLITNVDKKAIFITPNMTEHLGSPSLIRLLMDYPNSVLIIEDAETVLMKRSADNSNSVANLLNITDGLPADFLNLNVICTFNTDLEEIDDALLREGRLRGIQKFSKLDKKNAEKIAQLIDSNAVINGPKTLAEICNPSIKHELGDLNEVGFGLIN